MLVLIISRNQSYVSNPNILQDAPSDNIQVLFIIYNTVCGIEDGHVIDLIA